MVIERSFCDLSPHSRRMSKVASSSGTGVNCIITFKKLFEISGTAQQVFERGG